MNLHDECLSKIEKYIIIFLEIKKIKGKLSIGKNELTSKNREKGHIGNNMTD